MCVVFSFASLTMYVLYLPFYKPVMNIASIIHSSVFASATLFMACAEVRGFPEVRTPDCVSKLVALAFGTMAAS
jgi:4-hydroxybenzoate polyprenyltransferase